MSFTMTQLKTDIDALKAAIDALKAAMPSGLIVMWSGADVPAGWKLCNGQNSTPDLRNRFILGSGSRSIGATGGTTAVTLTVDNLPKHSHNITISPDSGHTHAGTAADGGGHDHLIANSQDSSNGYDASARPYLVRHGTDSDKGNSYILCGSSAAPTQYKTSSVGAHSHTVSINPSGVHSHAATCSDAGQGTALTVEPPYYVLAFIMKI